MSKTIKSPVEHFAGEITLPDYLTLPQALAFEQALADGSALQQTEGFTQTQLDTVLIQAVCAVVENWDLEGFGQLAPDTFPATPRVPSMELAGFLFNEIAKLYNPDVSEE